MHLCIEILGLCLGQLLYVCQYVCVHVYIELEGMCTVQVKLKFLFTIHSTLIVLSMV